LKTDISGLTPEVKVFALQMAEAVAEDVASRLVPRAERVIATEIADVAEPRLATYAISVFSPHHRRQRHINIPVHENTKSIHHVDLLPQEVANLPERSIRNV
jgi:hypothetical protein